MVVVGVSFKESKLFVLYSNLVTGLVTRTVVVFKVSRFFLSCSNPVTGVVT